MGRPGTASSGHQHRGRDARREASDPSEAGTADECNAWDRRAGHVWHPDLRAPASPGDTRHAHSQAGQTVGADGEACAVLSFLCIKTSPFPHFQPFSKLLLLSRLRRGSAPGTSVACTPLPGKLRSGPRSLAVGREGTLRRGPPRMDLICVWALGVIILTPFDDDASQFG